MAQTLTQEDLDAIAAAVHNVSAGGIVGLDTFRYYWNFAAEMAADAVWNEQYSEHSQAGSFGKLMDLLRKANYVVEGEVTAAISPTTLTFSSNVNYPSSAFAHAVLLFINGSTVSEQNSTIISYTQTNGVFVLEEPLTQAPVTGDEFIIIAGSHVHAINDMAVGVRSVGVGVRATQADDGTISLYEGMTYNGTAHSRISFTVAKDYTSATSITFSIYRTDNTTTAIKTAAASAVSSTLIELSTFEATFTPSLSYAGNPLVAELRYALIASFSGSLETVATGPLFVYDTPPTS